MTEGGRERERPKLDFYRADKSKAPVPFILGLFLDPPMILVTFVYFAMSLRHDDATWRGWNYVFASFFTYHGNFPEAIHRGEMSHTQKVTSVWANSHLPTDGYKTAPIVIKTSLPLCISFVSSSPRHLLFQTLLLNFIADIFNKFCCESNKI